MDMYKGAPRLAKRQKKTLNACQRCRIRKIKCSGQDPCRHCTSKRLECVFEDRGKKVVVTEEYLKELQNRALGNSSPAQRSPGHATQSSPAQTQPGLAPSNEPAQSSIGDEYRRLGHSSSWSFSRRVRNALHCSIGGVLHDEVPIRDGAYEIPWVESIVDLSGLDLPTKDFAIYLTDTLTLTLHPLYHLFDKEAFLRRLHDFYSTFTLNNSEPTDLWHIQMLIVFAFGYSILAREAGKYGPIGAGYIARVIKAVPDNFRLHQEPILSIEILCMLSLFMQAMDMRLAAYQYIGQALRIGLAQGMNRRFDAYHLRHEQFEHRSNLWWTIYIIDRKLSSLVGVPTTLHDEDIAIQMPPMHVAGRQDSSFALHVELSSQLGEMLNVVYGLGLQRQLGAKFVTSIQSILQRLADTATLLNTKMKIDAQKPNGTLFRTAASLHLLHHQCTVLAIRPVLFFLLETRLGSNAPLILADAVIGLLRVCVESAIQILKIVEGLRSEKLVDFFLPFDLDTAFAAAFVLVLVDMVAPASIEQWDLDDTFALMDEMLARGVVIAKAYKKDLLELDACRRNLKASHVRNTPHLQGEVLTSDDATMPLSDTQRDFSDFQPVEQDSIWAGIAMSTAELGALDSATIQQAIDSLNYPLLRGSTGMDVNGNDWMWGNF